MRFIKKLLLKLFEEEKNFKRFEVIFTILSGGLALLLKFKIDWPEFINHIDFFMDHLELKEYIYDVSLGIFSSMLLVCFIDRISHTITENDNKKKSYENIMNINIVLQKYLERYEKALYCVVTPINQRNMSSLHIPQKIQLQNIQDLYKPSFLISNGLTEPAIVSFFRIEAEIQNELKNIIRQTNFTYYPDFLDVFTEFIEVSINFNCRDFILDVPNRKLDGENMDIVINNYLKNSDNFSKETTINAENKQNNIFIPYTLLSKMLTDEYKIISKYNDLIKSIS